MQAFGIELPRQARLAAMVLAIAGLAICPPAGFAQKTTDQGAAKPAEESFEPYSGQPGKDVVWVPTPPEVVEAMLDMAKVKQGDKLVDLGSGDGRIAIAAAKRGAQAMGVEYNPKMVQVSERNAAREGVKNVRFVQGDLFETDFSDADVVTMYLLPMLNEKLRPQLLKMKPGTRLASHQFTMGNWRPDEKRTIGGHDALFWVVPAQVGGTWRVEPAGGGDPLQLELKQEYQELEARATWGDRPAVVSDVGLSGGAIRFAVADGRGSLYRFKGTAGHDGRMSGTVIGGDGREQPFTASRTSP